MEDKLLMINVACLQWFSKCSLNLSHSVLMAIISDGPVLASTRIFPSRRWWQLELYDMQSSSQIITTNKPTPNFLQAGCPSCHPSNSVKALKGTECLLNQKVKSILSCPFNPSVFWHFWLSDRKDIRHVKHIAPAVLSGFSLGRPLVRICQLNKNLKQQKFIISFVESYQMMTVVNQDACTYVSGSGVCSVKHCRW